ncbi:MAG: hypothetical protein OIN86_12975 [Candidatus Methanoperedens sp.]|nr:hypothetical protein [Candidatus Methanoperedens sp.]CAG0948697.1 hypothetical protein METP1_00049 [Methanosarcinales archaeon]
MEQNFVTLSKAGKILNINPEMLRKSVSRGLIDEKKEIRRGNSKITLIDINKIDKKILVLMKLPSAFRNAYLQRTKQKT